MYVKTEFWLNSEMKKVLWNELLASILPAGMTCAKYRSDNFITIWASKIDTESLKFWWKIKNKIN